MEKPFICKDVLLGSYFMFKGNPEPELSMGSNGRVVYLFDKTEKLMSDFESFKDGEFKVFIDYYYSLRDKMFRFIDERKSR